MKKIISFLILLQFSFFSGFAQIDDSLKNASLKEYKEELRLLNERFSDSITKKQRALEKTGFDEAKRVITVSNTGLKYFSVIIAMLSLGLGLLAAFEYFKFKDLVKATEEKFTSLKNDFKGDIDKSIKKMNEEDSKRQKQYDEIEEKINEKLIEVLSLKEDVEKTQNTSIANRTSFNDLYLDLIKLNLHTLSSGESQYKNLTKKYHSKLSKHETTLGLYSKTLKRVIVHLQELMNTDDKLNPAISVPLDHVEEILSRDSYPDQTSHLKKMTNKLIDKIRAKLVLQE